ncbi:alpha/beta hydrolase [Bacteroidetes/Chlorobi group bacterium Naka2016]|jgi:pimeloyl-ACP methyl ester carboxylesterase|nr:MAG: alpha/beta hydrolase [Bacteroidetes/Chlorobi group bacterium Naka2016]
MDLIDGVFLNAGDVNLYLKVQGEGNPPIVIEPAIGGLSVEWYYIQKELAKITTVVTYDRAGYGESPSSKQPRTSFNIANELFNMLFNSDVEHPYILVGHLEGGIFVQHFARLFHHYVAGVVLVDSLFSNYFALESEDFPQYYEIASYRTRIENLSKLSQMDKETFKKVIVPVIEELYANFPDEYRVPLVTYQTDQRFFQTTVKEMEALPESIKELGEANSFPEVPLLVISHEPKVMENLSVNIGIPLDESQKIENFWLENQRELSHLSPFGKFLIAENSDKNIHYSNPLFLIEAIKKFVEEVRSSNP